ncbi:MAG: DCC1-like thiol-disulfide oxidoreductase family protein [Tetrasphaera sp.]
MSARVLIFDGDCGICTTLAGVVERHVRPSPDDFEVMPFQRADLADLGLTEAQCLEALQWVGTDGRIRSAEDAVAKVLLAGRVWQRPLGLLLLVPGVNQLAGWVYRWVAANRHRLPGGTPACSMPDLRGPGA